MVKKKKRISRTYSKTSDESKGKIHGDIDASSLQGPSNESNNGRDEDGALSAKQICRFDAGEAANEAASLEEAIDGAFKLRGVGASIEIEVGDEGRLAERGGDDAGAVAVGHAAEGNEAHDLQVKSAIFFMIIFIYFLLQCYVIVLWRIWHVMIFLDLGVAG